MVALERGSSPVDAVPVREAVLPGPLAALADVPGTEYVLVVDATGERVRGELGGPPDDDLAVLSWARRLAAVSRERGREMEDVVLTTATAFHLVRAVPEAPGAAEVWVSVRVDRERGNLALARRALAGLAVPGRAGSGPRAIGPAPQGVPPVGPRVVESSPRGGSGRSAMPSPPPSPVSASLPAAMPLSGRSAPGPRVVEPSAGLVVEPSPATSEPALPGSDPAPPRSDPALPRVVEPPRRGTAEPSRPPERDRTRRPRHGADVPALAFLPPIPARAVGADDGARTRPSDRSPAAEQNPEQAPPASGDPRRRPMTVAQARTWRVPAPEVPAAREPLEAAQPAPIIPAPRTGSLFAPVVVVPPPPSPVDDDTTEVPAPVPYPIITAPPPAVPAAVPAVATTAGPAASPTTSPATPTTSPVDPTPEPAVTDVGLPRRVPGAQLSPPAAAPAPVGMPGWAAEPTVLRRLLSGLRRLT